MMTVTFTADLTILYFVAANIVGILAYVLLLKHRARTLARRQARLASEIGEYFRHSAAEVRVNCLPGPDGRRFIVTIDSEPLKRFRYSHIVEMSLGNHVLKACGVEIDRVYWRFPVKAPGQAATAGAALDEQPPQAAGSEDDYINDRLLRLKSEAEYQVSPASWEQFEAAVHEEESAKNLH